MNGLRAIVASFALGSALFMAGRWSAPQTIQPQPTPQTGYTLRCNGGLVQVVCVEQGTPTPEVQSTVTPGTIPTQIPSPTATIARSTTPTIPPTPSPTATATLSSPTPTPEVPRTATTAAGPATPTPYPTPTQIPPNLTPFTPTCATYPCATPAGLMYVVVNPVNMRSDHNVTSTSYGMRAVGDLVFVKCIFVEAPGGNTWGSTVECGAPSAVWSAIVYNNRMYLALEP